MKVQVEDGPLPSPPPLCGRGNRTPSPSKRGRVGEGVSGDHKNKNTKLFIAAFLLCLSSPTAAQELQVGDWSITTALGGQTSRPAFDRNAFSLAADNLDKQEARVFAFGNRLFNTNWVIAPASTEGFDGLGPLYNRVSCSGCHLRDGRGQPPEEPGGELLSMLVRLSLPGEGPHGGPLPHPVYGDQLSDRAVPGVGPEGRVVITWEEQGGLYGDGTPYSLRRPLISLNDLAYGPLGDVLLSARVAPAIFGLGLLEAIPEETLLALSDPEDANGDGISGRPNWVWDVLKQDKALGRFGWKAGQPSVRQQSAGAALGDIGLTSPLFPLENCSATQVACQALAGDDEPELANKFLAKLTFYGQTLAVPLARDFTALEVVAGAALFAESGCASCHTPTLLTGDHPVTALQNQTIHPFTDLLLHDLGEGLADGRPDFAASGSEWRTAPLWGLGLIEQVNGHLFLLHDGRARGLAEAILWHGGEAEAAKEAFRLLPATQRDQLLAFLRAL